MTTVIALEDDECMQMYADSQINSNGRPYFHSDMVKIIQRNQYVIGVAGYVAALQAIENNWNPPALASNYKGTLYSFVITKVIPSLKAFIDECKMFTDKQKEDGDLFSILLAIKGNVFEIDQDYSVARRDDGCYAIGSGSDFALGALMAGANAHEAMDIASRNDVNTHAPFIMIEQSK